MYMLRGILRSAILAALIVIVQNVYILYHTGNFMDKSHGYWLFWAIIIAVLQTMNWVKEGFMGLSTTEKAIAIWYLNEVRKEEERKKNGQ